MIALDTSVLYSYLVQDKETEDLEPIVRFFDNNDETELFFINDLVLTETITELEENIKFDKTDILFVLNELLLNRQIVFNDEENIHQAASIYESKKSRFSDCLQIVINRKSKASKTVTRKERMALLPDVLLLAEHATSDSQK